ncbi:MAG: hypothetical protein H6Q15_1052 [Bacteroidetes bacterium]|nr:hypothetical protein [Bacteroidota bacterium]
MKKQILSILGLILLSINTLFAYSFFNVSNGDTIYYNIKSTNTVEVTKKNYTTPYSGNIVIPDSVEYGLNTYYVTSIGNAFQFCNNLSSLSIPRFVTLIANYALVGCSNLTSIQVDSSNTRYSSNNGVLFSKSRDTILICPQGISGSYSIPNSVTTIVDMAFYMCINLTSVTIPNSVTSIGANAFIGCTALTSIFIPSSINSISQFPPFGYCENLVSINVDSNNIRYSSNNGVLFSKNFDTIITCPEGKSGNYSIPNSVNKIGNYAFYRCGNISSISLPNSIISIGDFAFSYCDSLESITIPDSVTFIGGKVFYACNNLKSLIFKSVYPPPTIVSTTFDSVSKNIPIFVPCSSMSRYMSTQYWSSITNFLPFIETYQNISATICQGDKYTVNGIDYDSSGLYKFVNGCDSVFLTLAVNPEYSSVLYDTICRGQLYSNYGFNFIADTSGLYTQNLQKTTGCDSIISLNLYVNPIYSISIHDTICKGQLYSNYGLNFIADTSGLYKNYLQTISGCDSIYKINLFVNPTFLTSIFDTICKGQLYDKFGFYFSADSSGKYSESLYSLSGCDSIVEVNLVVNQAYSTEINDTICKGQLYSNYGFNFIADTTGLYIKNLQTIKGCDSTVSLNLVINPTYSIIHYDNICQGQLYNNYGFNFYSDSTGLYIQNLQTIADCDSNIYLYLTVNPLPSEPYDLLVVHMQNYLEITWQGEGQQYELYRNDSLISTVEQPIYLDNNVENSSTYCYRVKALIGECESNFSDTVCGDYVGLENIMYYDKSILLYPNPAKDKINVEFTGISQNVDVFIYDIMGKEVARYINISTGNNLGINSDKFENGVYTLKIIGKKLNLFKKFIIEK